MTREGREDPKFCEDGAIIVVVKSTLRSTELEGGMTFGTRHGNTRSENKSEDSTTYGINVKRKTVS